MKPMDQKIGTVIIDSRGTLALDRGTEMLICSRKVPLKKYEIEYGIGFMRALRKGKKVAKEVLVSATPAKNGTGEIMTCSKNDSETFRLFDSEGKWLFFSSYYDERGKVIGFRAWLGELSDI